MKDILFISPNNARNIYQNLSAKYSAIEPPTWALLLAESCRSKGYSVGICDINAENLTELDLLSLDVDGIDYWVLKKLPINFTKIAIIEFNSNFGSKIK